MEAIPKVSVIIPLFNKGPHIARALNSVISQTHQDFEVIVIDDGSVDNGATIVNNIGDVRIRIIQQENQGASVARNKGIEAAKADLIAFLDADDEWLPTHLEVLLRLWNEFPEAGLYGTAYLIKSNNMTINYQPDIKEIPRKPWEGLLSSYFKSAALGDPPISTSTVAVPKNILIEMGGFIKDTWWGEDTDLWGRIALKYPIAFSWDGIGIYHTDALNRACNRKEPVVENIFIQRAMDAIGEGNMVLSLQKDLQEYIAKKQIEAAWFNIHVKRPDLARKALKNCVTKQLIRKKYWALFWAYVPPIIYEMSYTAKQNFKKN